MDKYDWYGIITIVLFIGSLLIFCLFGDNRSTDIFSTACNSFGFGDYVDSSTLLNVKLEVINGTQVECEKGMIINIEECGYDKWGKLFYDSCKTNWVIKE